MPLSYTLINVIFATAIAKVEFAAAISATNLVFVSDKDETTLWSAAVFVAKFARLVAVSCRNALFAPYPAFSTVAFKYLVLFVSFGKVKLETYPVFPSLTFLSHLSHDHVSFPVSNTKLNAIRSTCMSVYNCVALSANSTLSST